MGSLPHICLPFSLKSGQISGPLGFKYHEQERMLHVLDQMSDGYDCSAGLPKELCGAFVQRQPNWRQATQDGTG